MVTLGKLGVILLGGLGAGGYPAVKLNFIGLMINIKVIVKLNLNGLLELYCSCKRIFNSTTRIVYILFGFLDFFLDSN